MSLSAPGSGWDLRQEFLLLNDATISCFGIRVGSLDQDPITFAAQIDLSESECRIFETVRPPCKNTRLTSVEEANDND